MKADAVPSVQTGLKLFCNKCGNLLRFPGALIFMPPDKQGNCKKLHVCTACVPLLRSWVKTP